MIDKCEQELFKPVIFMDECFVPAGNNEEFINKYRFIRGIIRTILIPAFMGTNASAINFLGKSASFAGSREENYLTPWSYVVYKLPKASIQFVEEKKNELIRSSNEQLSDEQVKFVSVICDQLGKERPLFCRYFTSQFINPLQGPFEPLTAFSQFLNDIFKTFTGSKRIFKSDTVSFYTYNYAQISFALMNGIPKDDQEKMEEKHKKLKIESDAVLLRGVAIHCHLAYLKSTEFIKKNFPTYYGVNIDEGDDNLEIIGKKNCSFTIFQEFSPFDVETLAALAFFDTTNFNRIFVARKMTGQEEYQQQKLSTACTQHHLLLIKRSPMM